MFVVTAGSKAVLRVVTDKEHYFPIGRLLRIKMEKTQLGDIEVLCPEQVVAVGIKETPTVSLETRDSVKASVNLVVAVARNIQNAAPESIVQSLYGWAVNLGMESACNLDQLNIPLLVSALRPINMAPDMTMSDMWLYVNNHDVVKVDFKQLKFGFYEALAEVSRTTGLKVGDVFVLKISGQDVKINSGDTLRAGVTGAGMLAAKIMYHRKYE